MNKNKLIEWIDNPSLINEDATRELREIVHEFPASPVLHWLYLKGLQNQKSYLFNSALSRAAIGSPNRAHLLKWVGLEPEPEEVKKQRFEFVIPEKQQEPKLEPVAQEKEVVKPVEKVEVPKVEELIPEPVLEKQPEEPKEEVKETKKVGVTPPKPAPIKPVATKPKKEADLPDDIKALLARSRKIISTYSSNKEDVKESEPVVQESKPTVEEVPVEPEVLPVEEAIAEPKEEIAKVSAPVSELQPESELESQTEPEQEVEVEPEPELVPEPEEVKPVELVEESVEVEKEEIEEETYFSLDFGPGAEEEEPAEQVEEPEFETSFEIVLDDIELEDPVEEEVVPEAIENTQETVEDDNDFASWLKNLNAKKEEPVEEVKAFELDTDVVPQKPQTPNKAKVEKMAIIDKFLEEKPRIVPKKEQFSVVDLGQTSENDEGQYITETLAQIYVKQGHYNKAIEAYEILGLKYPEKNSFFADRIREIKRIK